MIGLFRVGGGRYRNVHDGSLNSCFSSLSNVYFPFISENHCENLLFSKLLQLKVGRFLSYLCVNFVKES